MRYLIASTALIFFPSIYAAETAKTIKFSYQSVEVGKIITDYAAASGQRFVVDEEVKGRATIINPRPISMPEAFAQLSSALAGNGAGIATDGDVMHVMSARSLQRDNVTVLRELPPAQPERMVTWIYQAKFISAEEVNTQLRILTSRHGELVPLASRNQLIISDWTTNLQRIAAILKEIDIPSAGKK